MEGIVDCFNDELQEVREQNYDINFAVEYAEYICMKYASDEEFLECHRSKIPDLAIYKTGGISSYCARTFGNLAYLAIHSPEPYRSWAKEMFEGLVTLDKASQASL